MKSKLDVTNQLYVTFKMYTAVMAWVIINNWLPDNTKKYLLLNNLAPAFVTFNYVYTHIDFHFRLNDFFTHRLLA